MPDYPGQNFAITRPYCTYEVSEIYSFPILIGFPMFTLTVLIGDVTLRRRFRFFWAGRIVETIHDIADLACIEPDQIRDDIDAVLNRLEKIFKGRR